MRFATALPASRASSTGYVTYLTGCNQCLVVPRISPTDGKLMDSHWLDEQRLVVLSDSPIVLDNGSAPGFDKEPPKR
jgi:hypothetical protein